MRVKQGSLEKPASLEAAAASSAPVSGSAGVGDGLPAPRSLSVLRGLIDETDTKLVALLNERAKLVVEVGRAKAQSKTAIYVPHREQAVLQRVISKNSGPLLDRTIEAIWKEIMSGSFALEQPLRVGFLGPRGSFAHAAASRQFGASVSFEDVRTAEGALNEVCRGHIDYAVLPIENSVTGGVDDTMDAVLQHASRGARIINELRLPTRHAMHARCKPKEISRIYGTPEALGHCSKWLAVQFPSVQQVPTASDAEAVALAAAGRDDPDRHAGRATGASPLLLPASAATGASAGGSTKPAAAGDVEEAEEAGSAPECSAPRSSTFAAVASPKAGAEMGLPVLFPATDDEAAPVTRFVVVALQSTEPSGQDKTSMALELGDAPGALVHALSPFAEAGINLTHLDKRPRDVKASGEPSTYVFFLDAQGHTKDSEALRGAIEAARKHCRTLVLLGSYPIARRLLQP